MWRSMNDREKRSRYRRTAVSVVSVTTTWRTRVGSFPPAFTGQGSVGEEDAIGSPTQGRDGRVWGGVGGPNAGAGRRVPRRHQALVAPRCSYGRLTSKHEMAPWLRRYRRPPTTTGWAQA